MKILDTNNLLDAVEDLQAGKDDPQLDDLAQAVEDAVDALAAGLADRLGIEKGKTTYEREFGGLCASFKPRYREQPCPPCIEQGDPGGDWDESEYEHLKVPPTDPRLTTTLYDENP